MRKPVWMGVAVVATLIAALTLYFVLKTDNVGRSYHNKTLTPIPAPNATTGQTAPNMTFQTPPPTVNVTKPPFNASAYEVNYTITFSVSTGGITVTIEGWTVIGVGPFGNYSFGVLTIPLRGAATYKTVTTEDGATYTLACALDYCRAIEEEEWPFTRLIDGINVTRTVLGPCQRLNYTGVSYEERGVLDPKALRRLLQEVSGNYTAYVCEVNGVVLSADLISAAVVYDASVRVTLKMEAAQAGPYSPETYRKILQEIKERLRNETAE